MRLLQRASPAPGTGAVASGTAAVGVGGGDVAQEARGASPRSRSMPRSLPSTALEEITEDREDGQAGRHAEEEGLATMRAWHDGAGKA